MISTNSSTVCVVWYRGNRGGYVWKTNGQACVTQSGSRSTWMKRKVNEHTYVLCTLVSRGLCMRSSATDEQVRPL